MRGISRRSFALWHGLAGGMLAVLVAAPAGATTLSDELVERLRTRIDAATSEAEVDALVLLGRFYQERHLAPVWVTEEGATERAAALAAVLKDAAADGLDPHVYGAQTVEALLPANRAEDLAELELRLSLGVIRIASDLAVGRLEPSRVDPELFIFPEEIDQARLIRDAADSDDIAAFVGAFRPAQDEYRRLKAALAGFREVAAAGGWPGVYHRTPAFSGEMTYLEINPYWHVPPSIARNELLPRIQADPGYLAAGNFDLLSGWSDGAALLDPTSIDWGRVSAEDFAYKVRQRPGPGNALGRIKFMFPNRFNVYLHDTPARALFDKNERSFSHGCIRVEHPERLAALMLERAPGWSLDAIHAAINSGDRQIATLSEPVPVHIAYLTAWVNRDGSVHFRRDVYGRDRRLEAALLGPPLD